MIFSRGRKRKILACTMLILRLLLVVPQPASASKSGRDEVGSSEVLIYKTKTYEESSAALNQNDLTPSGKLAVNIPHGGDNKPSTGGKFGPRAKARGAAKSKNFARQQRAQNPSSEQSPSGQSTPNRQSGRSFFAHSFTVRPQFPARPGPFNRLGRPLGQFFGKFKPSPPSGRGKFNPYNPYGARGPSSITVVGQSKSSDNLTKEERRQLPHHHDKMIEAEGHPRLRVGFWQSRFKVPDHGAIHGLPYTVKNNGGTKTEKSDENALAMMQSIENMPNRPKVIWFDQDDVTFQGGTERGFPAVHIFDDDTKVIAVFNKQTGNFVTTCQLTRDQEIELKATHNFGGKDSCPSAGQAKNLPPQQTAVNTFESDVTGITPINPMDENSSPGFTPTSSFESDVMGITPIDNSQFDNP